MQDELLYETAKAYIRIIEEIEKTKDPLSLIDLEEKRVMCHNALIDLFKINTVKSLYRENVTRIAYRIVQQHDES